MQYEFILNTSGAVTLSKAPDQDMLLWSGDVMLGLVGAGSHNLPLHAIANNMATISRFGMTLASPDFSEKQTLNAAPFLEWYGGEKPLIKQLQAMIGPNKWVVYSIGISSGQRVTANFGLIIPKALKGQRFVFSCNGQAMDQASYTLDPHLAASHWFMPNESVLGCRAVFEAVQVGDVLEFSISFPDQKDTALSEKFLPLLSYTNPVLLAGLPDVARIRRVSGPVANQNSFLNGGLTAAQRLSVLIDRYHPKDGDIRRVLDWGIGCGRVARHLTSRPDIAMTGIDIDRDNLEWCKTNLPGRYETVELFPPIPFDDHAFDVIYSCSVLSHLTEDAAHAWLAELSRVLAPAGVALLSFNGSANLASYLSRRPLEMQRSLRNGLFDSDINHDLDGFIPSTDYYRATFAQTSWWTAVFEQHFDIVAIEPSVVSGYQDIAVLKRR